MSLKRSEVTGEASSEEEASSGCKFISFYDKSNVHQALQQLIKMSPESTVLRAAPPSSWALVQPQEEGVISCSVRPR